MSVASTSVWEIRDAGNDANGGGFDAAGSSPGTDYSQQDSPQVTIDGATVTAVVHTTTTQLTLTGVTVTAAHNRNFLRISGGTATAGTYEITAVDTVNNRWTLDRSAGTAAQTATGRMGGALATLGFWAGVVQAGNLAWLKGTQTISSSTANVSNGRLSLVAADVQLIGYGSTRGDKVRPVIQSSIGSIQMITTGAARVEFKYLEFRSNSQNNVEAIRTNAASTTAYRCRFAFDTFTSGQNYGVRGNNATTRVVECEFTGDFTVAILGNSDTQALGCVAHDVNAVTAVFQNGNHDRCIVSRWTNGRAFYLTSAAVQVLQDCVAVGGTGSASVHAFEVNTNNHLLLGCLGYDAEGQIFKNSSTGGKSYLLNCAGGAGAVANYTPSEWAAGEVENFVELTVDPFADSAGDDFALNSTAGGGADLAGAGWPSSWLGLSTSAAHPPGATGSPAAAGGGSYSRGRVVNAGG